MILDLSELKEVGSTRKLEQDITFDDFTYQNREIGLPDPFHLSLNIFRTKDSFLFTGTIKGNIILECSRCLEKFSFAVNMEIDDELNFSDIKDLKNVQLSDMLKEYIYLAIPIKPLCSEDCKGLCSQCGTNLNYGDCDCEKEIMDPRLAKLRDFYNDEE